MQDSMINSPTVLRVCVPGASLPVTYLKFHDVFRT